MCQFDSTATRGQMLLFTANVIKLTAADAGRKTNAASLRESAYCKNSPSPRSRSEKSVADTRFVKYLTKCRRFLRGFLRILFSSRLALALNLMTLARKDVFFLRRHAFAQIKT